MYMKEALLCGLVWALLSSTGLRGENNNCAQRTTLVAVATNGEPAEALNASDFKVTVGKKAVTLDSATAGGPPRVVLLVDASSNHDQPGWAASQAMMDSFLGQFPDAGVYTLVVFDDKIQRVVNQTSRLGLQGALGEVFPSGKPPSQAGLDAAFRQASTTFGAYRTGDTEFLLTTSDDVYKATELDLEKQRESGFRLFGASFDQTRRRGTLLFGSNTLVQDYTPLQAAARASGGLWIQFDMTQKDQAGTLEMARADGKVAGALARNYWVLKMQVPSASTKPEKVKIETTKNVKGKGQDRLVIYPQEMFPCQ